MQEIKFRGKRVDNREWVYGNLIYDNIADKYWIVLSINESEKIYGGLYIYAVEVIPNTIGQFTGLYDKNEEEIYEGDILKDKWNTIYVVKYKNSGFYIYRKNGRNGYSKIASWNGEKEIIGNIHNNKNLLGGE